MNLPITIPTHRDVAWYVEECRVLKAALDGLQHPYIESRKRMAALETELDKLRAQIGTPPDGSHPDEQIPRAGTWHQERLNWISEIETARAYIAKCETQIIERDQLRTELALLREWQREVIQNANAHHAERRDAIARAESAEREAFDWKKIARYETARAERAEREVAGLKANNRFQRGHSAGYAEAKADCATELAAERARLALATAADALR